MDQQDRSDPAVCAECGQAKPAEAFYLIRGPLAYGDWRAQPCAACCRQRLSQTAVRQ